MRRSACVLQRRQPPLKATGLLMPKNSAQPLMMPRRRSPKRRSFTSRRRCLLRTHSTASSARSAWRHGCTAAQAFLTRRAAPSRAASCSTHAAARHQRPDFGEARRRLQIGLPVVMMTGHGDIPMTVRAMKVAPWISRQAVPRSGHARRGEQRRRDRARRADSEGQDAMRAAFETLSARAASHGLRRFRPDEQADRARAFADGSR